jgi:hypothetical protein
MVRASSPDRPRFMFWPVWPSVSPGTASPVVAFNYDREIPPWWAGPYGQDVPK